MEGDSDNFLKALQKRQRNLAKKLDRIKKKQAEVKGSGKDMKEEEKKMIESAPQIEELLGETEKLIQQYLKHLETATKVEKKPVIKEEDRSKDVIAFWVIGEFLANQQVKDRFVRENPSETQDLDAFLLFHSQAKGQSGKKFTEISSEMEKSVELFLSKSDKIASGTLRTYKKHSEFAAKYLTWAQGLSRPQTPPRSELSVQSGPVYSTQTCPPETKAEVEEVKVEVKENKERKEHKVEPIVESGQSRWANDEEDEWNDAGKVENKGEVKKENEDEGFITVTGRKKANKGEGEKEREDWGERRRCGRRGGRRGGRGRGEGNEREGEEFRGERRRGGRRGGRRGDGGDRAPREDNIEEAVRE